jgi:hypothetical protein
MDPNAFLLFTRPSVCACLLFTHHVLSAWGEFCAWKGVETIWCSKVYDSYDVDHIVIMPTYKEETELLRQTLDPLTSHLQTRDRYHMSCDGST